jgi:hypothetical protein
VSVSASSGRAVLILKSAKNSRPSGEWDDDDYDVLADGVVVGRIFNSNAGPVGSPWMWTRADPRGRDGRVCKELATGVRRFRHDHHQTDNVFDRVCRLGGPRCPIRCMGLGTGRAWINPRGPHADTRLRVDARGGDDSVRKELAAGMT